MNKFLKLVVVVLLLTVTVQAQEKLPYWNDIQAFKKQDSASFPGAGKILFAGSSSFTNWKDVQTYFPAYPIINRGFGGSTLVDVIRYQHDIIFPYQPRQIIIYCGENDIANDSTVTGKMVFKRFKTLYLSIRKNLMYVPVAYVSMKPSPSRWHLRDKYIEGNRLIKEFLEKKKRSGSNQFINVWDVMLGPDGKPMPDIFVGDNLHMNAKGYAIWQKIIEPYLIK